MTVLTRISLHGIACLILAAGLLAACGAAPPLSPSSAATAQPTASQSTGAAPTAQPEITQPVATAATEASAQPTTGGRSVTHAMGTTSVPTTPRRVIVLDNGTLDNVLALGVAPVGAATVLDGGAFPTYLQEQAKGIETVGTIDQPNLERILMLKPDLILGSKDTHEAIYPQLSQIAPTVFVETLGATWKTNLVKQAETLGKADEAQRLLDEYQGRLDMFQSKMGDRLKQTTVSVVRSRPDKVSVYLKQSFVGTIIEEAGLARPAAQQKDAFSEDVTLELIPNLDSDVIFWTQRDPSKSQLVELMKQPLWSGLKAAKQGRVHEVSHETWISGLGIISANRVLDDLFTYLVDAKG